MTENCEIREDFYDTEPVPVEKIQVIEMTNPWIVNLPEGVTFQQLVDQKKIVFREIFTEIVREVLVIVVKEVTVPPHAKVMTITIDTPFVTQKVEWKTNEVMYTEGMFVFKNVVVERIVEILAEKTVHKYCGN
jgi:hypothetical protein